MTDRWKYPPALLRLALGGVFLYAGAVKIGDLSGFAGDIAAYRLLPHFGNYLAAAVIPWLEALCGVLLITGWRVRGAASLIMALTLVFMAALASVLVRGLDIDCGCFRHGGAKTSAWTALGRDSLLLAATIVLLRKTTNQQKT
ncbi:MAG: DoxX family membrane protein [Geobacteraceae bacterium]|nr:DoxX family membrane protein [Geobacteraceae bacterium]